MLITRLAVSQTKHWQNYEDWTQTGLAGRDMTDAGSRPQNLYSAPQCGLFKILRRGTEQGAKNACESAKIG